MRPSPADGINTESYPNPFTPDSVLAIMPSQTPETKCISPLEDTSATTVRNRAERTSSCAIFDNNNSRFSESVALSEANRALCTPGAPCNASTSSPVSSASAHWEQKLATSTALMIAFPSRVGAVSSISLKSCGRGNNSTPSGIMRFISATLCALALAHTMCNMVYRDIGRAGGASDKSPD